MRGKNWRERRWLRTHGKSRRQSGRYVVCKAWWAVTGTLAFTLRELWTTWQSLPNAGGFDACFTRNHSGCEWVERGKGRSH